APAEPIVREPPNSESPRHLLTRCSSPPCDRRRDDPTLVCVTRKPSGEAARPHGNGWLLRGEGHFSRRLDRVARGEEIAITNQPRPEAVVLGRPPEGAVSVR